MAVYVDALTSCMMNPNWRWPKSCHMFADTEEELHTFAQSIGLKRSWFQDHSRLAHYDLNESRRMVALRHGAVQVDRKFVSEWMQKHQRTK